MVKKDIDETTHDKSGLLERQCQSGLSVKAFCRNKAYYSATFYYWKKKFCALVPTGSPPRTNDHAEDFAPVRFPAPQRQKNTSAAGDLDEIMVEGISENPALRLKRLKAMKNNV